MRPISILLILLALGGAAAADPVETIHGGDVYLGGSGTARGLDASRDVFAGGNSITLSGQVAEDIHASGFNVDIEARAAGNVYAAGATVTMRAPVGKDLTSAGFTLRTSPGAEVAGNARLAGGTVTIDGAVKGALSAAGGEVILNAPIGGDAWITAGKISFGPDALVAGRLNYSTPDEISIPERVADPARVTYSKLDRRDWMREMRKDWEGAEYPVLPTFMSLLAGFIITLAFFIILGAIFLAFMPRHVQRLREQTLARPGLTLLSGVIGLSILFGLVPISAMTIIGIPMVPVVLLAIVVFWILGYVLGAYVLAMRFWQSFGPDRDPSMTTRLIVLAAGVTVAALLNFIPFVGWIVNFALVLLGIGALTRALFDRLTGDVAGPALDVDMKPITDHDT